MTMPTPDNQHLNYLCNRITEKTGIGFDERKRKQLGEIVETRCRRLGLNHINDYYNLLRNPSVKGREFGTLMDILTIQESFFFRHKAQFQALRHFCLAPMMNQKKADHRKINIWSAGCANGEEAYSIAMLVRELASDDFQMKFHIKGTDISRQALLKAKEGVYTERAIRGLAPHYLDRYFTKQGDRYLLSADIKTMVDFEYFNLSEEPFPMDTMPRWDIIFCRNVIIYFTQNHSRKLMKNFYASMADGGFLFAGFSETMRYLNDDFIPIQMDDAFIYQKPFPGQPSTSATAARSKSIKKHIAPLEKKSGRHFQKSPSKKPILSSRGTRRTTTGPAEINLPQTIARPKKIENADRTPSTFLDENLSVARELADKGETIAAATILDNIVRQDPLLTEAYFMLAMIHNDAGNLDQSRHYLKKVTYLEPENPLAHLHLADIFKAASRKKDAAREYTTVISLLENRKNPETDELGDGFTSQAILTAARAHLKGMGKYTS
ncbi:MAG TPA: CheR family methyltransferase [Desulfobacteria bacterium]|nr:CheR family methyltransferase [Desulfobacteria bacterium]